MKKNIYTGIFCTILGLCINTPANASIVSSGFLDEKLTEMTNATALQLDTKANQRDLNFINTEVDPAIWNDQRESIKWSAYSVAPIIAELFPDFVDEPYVPGPISVTLLNSLKEIDRPGIAGFTNKLLNGWTDSENKTYLGVKGLNDNIGNAWPYTFTLSSGLLQGTLQQYPMTKTIKNASGLAQFLFGHGNTGVLNILAQSVVLEGAKDRNTGQMIGNFRSLTQLTNGWTGPTGITILGITGLNGKIGTLPEGITVQGMLEGWTDSESNTYLGVKGLNDKIGTIPDGKNLAGMISETDAKIGDLPTEYATVGAALSAIKGIAEEAKAAALAAIPDPKTEGSNGKYVLTVDIVGDNATYRWEPIDRGETTPTTE